MNRVLRRATLGAAAFFAASAFAAPAAFADTTADLGITLGGTTLDLGTTAKDVHLSVTNHGTGTADGFKLTFDTTALDTSKVKLVLPESSPGFCDTAAKTCTVTAQMANAENFDFPVFQLERVPAASAGEAGKLTVSISSATADPNSANNSVTVDVHLAKTHGVDLKVLADDIWAGIDDEGNPIPVKPGEVAEFSGHVYNQGSVAGKGAKVTLVLPPGVTFAEHFEECTYSDGDTKLVCSDNVVVFQSEGDQDHMLTFATKVKVGSTVAGPANIPGGTLTIEALGEVEVPEVAARGAAPQNTGLFKSNAEVPEFKDVDITDNSDDFIAYVGGTGNLPKTGTNVMLIAGIGAGVLIAGGALFLITRRRRVVA